jgi:TldD protein
MFSTTRRDFLATTSLALASPLLPTRGGHVRRLPADAGRSRFSANAWLPDPVPGEELRALATHAMDAAKDAGAAYADIRLAERHWMTLYMSPAEPLLPNPRLEATIAYGVRVVVDGASAFVYGTTLTSDAVAAAARSAVRTARGYASKTTRLAELAPVPVVKGEWTTPHELDPFTVPLEDHAAVLGAYRAASIRVLHGRDTPGFGVMLDWTRERRVFASTEGALVTQGLFHAAPSMVVLGDLRISLTSLMIPGLMPMSGGFETVTNLARQDTIKRVTEEAVQLASLPRGTVDVGRYPVVFDGMALGAIVGQTLGPALELDRVAGLERDAGGDSFLKSPVERLGTQIATPLLSVTANRAPPSAVAVQWDDDGVVPREYTCIRDGRLMDYHTSRTTAPLLDDWYKSQGMPSRSNGSAVAPRAELPVMVRAPHLTVASASRTASLSDLCRDMGRGLLVRGVPHVSTDHQFVSASIAPGGSNQFGVCEMFEIERGVPVRCMQGNAVEFTTPKFLQSLVALGDTTTTNSCAFDLYKGNPWKKAVQSVTAPAGVVKEVNVIATNIQL